MNMECVEPKVTIQLNCAVSNSSYGELKKPSLGFFICKTAALIINCTNTSNP